MSELKFDGEIIPVTHLLPDDVLVFSARVRLKQETLLEIRRQLREQFPEPRKILVTNSDVGFAVDRDGAPIPLGES